MVPVASMVTETATGTRHPHSPKARSTASNPALMLRVSWQVSSSR
jgi:hypothetical protein